jgi:hypothetical protein
MPTTLRPFDYGMKNYIDRLNDLYNTGVPRVRTDPADPDTPGTDVTASRQMRLADNGCCADCRGATITITFHPECLVDGFSMLINAVSGGSVTMSVAGVGFFIDGAGTQTSKTIAVGNAAIISSDGIGFRIFRMAST